MKRGRNQRRRQGVNPNRALDSNGPDVRIRGTANQIYDKYQALARDAHSAGDRVKAENYLQHAEHYYRVIRATQPSNTPIGDQMDGDMEDQPVIGEGREHRERSGQSDRNTPRSDDDFEDQLAIDAGGVEDDFGDAPAPRRDSVHTGGHSGSHNSGSHNSGGHNGAGREGGPRHGAPREGGENDPRRARRRRPRRPGQREEGERPRDAAPEASLPEEPALT